MSKLLEVNNLATHFFTEEGIVKAVNGITYHLDEGEILGLVGESGCGKSTVGRVIMRLLDPTAGEIRLKGEDISRISKSDVRQYRREMQMVFQDPYS